MSRDNFVEEEGAIRAQKARIRQEMHERRRDQSAAEAADKGGAILRRLMTLQEYQNAHLVHSFVSMPGEIDTRGLIEEALSSGRRVAVPVVRKGRRNLLHSEIKTLSDLRPEGKWGLYQPPPDGIHPVAPEEIDLVIVPGLAFDLNGNRVGFGAGYYDRFLTDVRAPKVAVAYAFQMLSEVPVTAQDVRMDLVVTEEKVHRCKGTGDAISKM